MTFKNRWRQSKPVRFQNFFVCRFCTAIYQIYALLLAWHIFARSIHTDQIQKLSWKKFLKIKILEFFFWNNNNLFQYLDHKITKSLQKLAGHDFNSKDLLWLLILRSVGNVNIFCLLPVLFLTKNEESISDSSEKTGFFLELGRWKTKISVVDSKNQ